MNAITSAPTVEEVLADETSSQWIRLALTCALRLDPGHALNDALVLAAVLDMHSRLAFDIAEECT